IQLARWAGAQVAATVSSAAKGSLATAAGAHHVIDYTGAGAAEAVREVFPEGAHLIVEVAPAVNAALDTAVIAPDGTVAFYANNGGDQVQLAVRQVMAANTAWAGMLLYTMAERHKAHAVTDVSLAVAAGALKVGEQHGLPLHRYRLDQAGQAHDAVEGGAIGKVLIDVP
ncbi:MAG: zinc-binding dehydrogenase, partial [Actinocrinis sp.]